MPVQIPSAIPGQAGLEVSEAVFGGEFNEALVHQLVVAYQAAGRSGTKAQKTRAEVSGGGAKPWKQKGSGRARAGTTRGPLWRTGGVTFAASPRSFRQKLNKKMYRSAMRSIFSELLRQNRLFINDALAPAEPKTRQLVEKLNQMSMAQGVLVTDAPNETLSLACRNLPGVDVLLASALSPVALVNSDKVILTVAAAKHIESGLV